jgi:hypothetical protein
MSLIKCSECQKEISSLAKTCPACGNPIEAVTVEKTSKKWKKMELGAIPSGNVSELNQGRVGFENIGNGPALKIAFEVAVDSQDVLEAGAELAIARGGRLSTKVSARYRLLMLEVWGRLFFQGASRAGLVAELSRHTTIEASPA